jgi:hypothetical protein
MLASGIVGRLRYFAHFIHGFYKMDREAGEYLPGMCQVLLIVLRKCRSSPSVGGQEFFLDPTDRQTCRAA